MILWGPRGWYSGGSCCACQGKDALQRVVAQKDADVRLGPLGSRERAEWRFRGLLSGELLLMKERLAESLFPTNRIPRTRRGGEKLAYVGFLMEGSFS